MDPLAATSHSILEFSLGLTKRLSSVCMSPLQKGV
jgi:hypothetical protein